MKKIIEILKKHKKLNSCVSSIFNFIAFNRFKKNGKTNKIKKNKSLFYKCKIIIKGKNNIIEFGNMCLFKNMIININGDNNYIKIGQEVIGKNVDICVEDNSNKLLVDDYTYFAGNIHIAITEGKKVCIGKKCLFSNSIVIRTGDSHSVLDNSTKKRINVAKDVIINDHVWVTERVLILKGSIISSDTIVASNSVITKQFFNPNVILGGCPTRILKENITWEKDRI